MDYKFDTTTEPWIPVVRNGTLSEVSLRDVGISAHEISAISDPIPIVEFGIYRLLVALVMDIWQFEDSRDLEDLMDLEKFDPGKIENYFDKYQNRFDLFDRDWPFLQTGNMGDEPKPISGILPSIPSGTSAYHFHHFRENNFGVAPAPAARLLTTFAPFMTAGGAGKSPSINGAPPWYVLINGQSLFHTICLNCYVGPLELLGDAPPAWRNPLPPKSDGRCTRTSLPEALTWRPRQIQLIPDGPGVCSLTGVQSPVLVNTMKFLPGASCDFTWTDPSVPYRITEKGSIVMRPQDGKEIWRDTGPLALLHDKTYESSDTKIRFSRPLLVDQFQRFVEDQRIDKDTPLSLTVYGMRTDMKMKVFEWQREMLRIPLPMVIGSKFSLLAQEFMEEANGVEYELKRSIKHLYPRDAAGNAKGLGTLIANTTRQFWFDLRPKYEDMLNSLSNAKDEEQTSKIRDEWRDSMMKIAWNGFNSASDGFDTYADSMQREVEARLMLKRRLFSLFETPDEKASRIKASKKGGRD